MGAICLLALDLTPQVVSPFWILYIFCGLTDILDGYLARRLHAVTEKGALLDSFADIAFVFCSAFKLVPFLILPSWLWVWVCIIVGIKITNQILAWVLYRKWMLPHTLANKLTGLFLFICIPLFVCFGQFLPLLFTSALATIAAVHEGYCIGIAKHASSPF